MKKIFLILLLPLYCFAQTVNPQEAARWEAQAQHVTVMEDDWGVPHIYGKTDADVVFGLMYVQCQQNFARVEKNYLEIMGRMAELEGEKKLYDDLQMRMIYDSAAAKKDFLNSPLWMKKLLNAFADGINFYLYKHPETKPLLLQKFEPWFPLMYTDGSISPTQTGGLTLQDLKNLYHEKDIITSAIEPGLSINSFNPSGSNGFAVAPSKTASKHAMLYINPHVTFYFRTEVHLVSEEGLNAYGAVTWGQFFIYQGFNEFCGWMHTSSYADVADVYTEKLEKEGNNAYYWMDGQKKKLQQEEVSITYVEQGKTSQKTFPVFRTEHGPVMGKRNNQILSLQHNNRSLSALLQSWLRTKAKGLSDFKKVMELGSNNSNNTVFADNKGNIAYWHGNFMPKRNAAYNWSLPVDGTISATKWKGLHTVNETVHLYNPKSGWIQNCNSTPFTAAGSSSPQKAKYPAYMAPEGENGRAVTAARLLSAAKNITLDDLVAIGYNRHLAAFDILLPSLFTAYNSLAKSDILYAELTQAISLLSRWNRAADASSIATTLAIEWATKMATKIPPAKTTEAATNAIGNYELMANTVAPKEQLLLLKETMNDLQKLYGKWQMPWGDVNRFQRPVNGKFNDEEVSLPVSLGPGTWGSLPSFVSRRMDTKKRYGVSGNSFVAAVEFGKRIKAKTILTGGESFDPASPHHIDQANGFITGQFKDIYFYKEDVLKKAKRTYHPGE